MMVSATELTKLREECQRLKELQTRDNNSQAQGCPEFVKNMCVTHLIDNCQICRDEYWRKTTAYTSELVEMQLKLEHSYRERQILQDRVAELEQDRNKWKDALEQIKKDRFAKIEKVTALLSAVNSLTQ